MSRLINDKALVTLYKPSSHISEAYRLLRTNTQFSSINGKNPVILVTSAKPGEGKSTTVSNLAVTYALENKQVLLIDADLRKPSLHTIFMVTNREGLSKYLSSQSELEAVIQPTMVPHLSILTSGPIPPNPAELLASGRMADLLAQLKPQYDVILIDSPPVLAVTDAQIISSRCEGVLLVIHAGKTKRSLIKKAKANLDHVKAKFLGAVLNNVQHKAAQDYYSQYYGEKKA